MPKEVFIPFQPEFRESMLSGEKTATTRTRRYGNPGDWFPAFGRVFVLTEVYPAQLYDIIFNHYKEEGFDSPQAFIAYWNRLHPRIGYLQRTSRKVFFHRFEPKGKSSPVIEPSPVPALSQKQEAKHV